MTIFVIAYIALFGMSPRALRSTTGPLSRVSRVLVLPDMCFAGHDKGWQPKTSWRRQEGETHFVLRKHPAWGDLYEEMGAFILGQCLKLV